jgi:rhodanese-related sulfurtransferase
MKKAVAAAAAAVLVFGMSGLCSAATPEENEKKVFEEMSALIPKDKFASIDDLYAKWKEILEKKSQALVIDIRTHEEFDNGHLLGSSNVDSGHAYQLVKRVTDPSAEIWVLCRTKHRATYFGGQLYKYGYTNVHVVDGGIAGWAEKGYPLVNEYLGEIKVTKYDKRLKEDFLVREGH